MAAVRKIRRRRPPRRTTSDSSDLQRRILRGILFFGAAILVVIFFFGDHGLYQLYKVRGEREQLIREIEQLRANRIKLEVKKDQLTNDFEHIERLARERYRMAKKGEKVFKVIDAAQKNKRKSSGF